MPPDPRQLLHGAAATPSQGLDVDAIAARARRLRVMRVLTSGLTSVAMLSVVLLITPAAMRAINDRGKGGEQGVVDGTRASVPLERVATFVIRAVDGAGAIDPNGTYSTFTGAEISDQGWSASFSVSSCSDQETAGCEPVGDFRLAVELSSNELSIADIEGESLSVEQRQQVLTYTESLEPAHEKPSLEPLSFVSSQNATGGSAIEGTLLWTGSLSGVAFGECSVPISAGDGKKTSVRNIYISAPSDLRGRQSGLQVIDASANLPFDEAEVSCRLFEEQQAAIEMRGRSTDGYRITLLGLSYATPRGSDAPTLAIEPAGRDVLMLQIRAEWVEDTFPGTRNCLITLENSAGERIYTGNDPFVLATESAETKIPITPTGPLTSWLSGEASCSEKRLDDPLGFYRTARTDIRSWDSSGASVIWSFEYQGDPGLDHAYNVCTFSFFDEHQTLIASDEITFYSQHEIKTLQIDVGPSPNDKPWDDSQQPTGISVSCEPYQDPPPPG